MASKNKLDEIIKNLPSKVINRAKVRTRVKNRIPNHLTLAKDIEGVQEIVREEISKLLNPIPPEQWSKFEVSTNDRKAIRELIKNTVAGYDQRECRKLVSLGSTLIREWQNYIQNAGTLKHLEKQFSDFKNSIKLNKSE